jgi:hypothetical protein
MFFVATPERGTHIGRARQLMLQAFPDHRYCDKTFALPSCAATGWFPG